MIQLSIIIPAYNAESFITRCIQSIVQQDIPTTRYEVIIINDGSTDHTAEIVNELCKKHSFLKMITTTNQGLSMARNRGIKEAKGEYILFVDSDDTIQPYVLESIYNEMKQEELDMMLMNYQQLTPQKQTLNIFFQMDKNSRQVASGRNFLSTNAYPPMVWAYAYKRTFLTENQLEMTPMWHEDEEFTPRAIYLAQRIKYSPILYYNYYQNKDSYMGAYKEDNFLYLIQAMGSLKRFINKYPSDLQGQRFFNEHISGIILFLLKEYVIKGCTNKERIIQKLREEKILPLVAKRKRFYISLINLSPSLFITYYRLFRK